MSDDGFGGHIEIRGTSNVIPTEVNASGEVLSDGLRMVRVTFGIYELEADLTLNIEQSRALREQLRLAEENAIAEGDLEGDGEGGEA
jgi:hypothetical protein